MEQTENYLNYCKGFARNLSRIAKDNKVSLVKVMNVYNKFNHVLYKEDKVRYNIIRSRELGGYKHLLEEKALELTQCYFNLSRN
jgi:hypothetical protein